MVAYFGRRQFAVAKAADEFRRLCRPLQLPPVPRSLNYLTPADVYVGRGQTILLEREKTKRKTIEQRRLQHAKTAA